MSRRRNLRSERAARRPCAARRQGLRAAQLWALLATCCAIGLQACGSADAIDADRRPIAEVQAEAEQSLVVLSEVYSVDRKYKSMMGPFSSVPVLLGASADDDPEGGEGGPAAARDEVFWITGYRAEMMAADGTTPMPQEFMCHSNLDLDVTRHQELLGVDPSFSPRLFTLSQGQLEIDFPPGFGIPVRGDESLDLTTQVLNLNVDDASFEVRHKVTIDYVADAAVAGRMRALQPIAAYGLALTEGTEGYFGIEQPDPEQHGPGCLVGSTASDHVYEDGLGRSFTGHWQVPPGRQENRTLVTQLMRVPYATRVHYVAVHLHPFATSLELRDLTADETVFRSEASNFEGKIGLAHVEYLTDLDGVEIYPDHEYELISVYDNSSGEIQDSMAVMYIYLRDLVVEKRLGIDSPREAS